MTGPRTLFLMGPQARKIPDFIPVFLCLLSAGQAMSSLGCPAFPPPDPLGVPHKRTSEPQKCAVSFMYVRLTLSAFSTPSLKRLFSSSNSPNPRSSDASAGRNFRGMQRGSLGGEVSVLFPYDFKYISKKFGDNVIYP